MQPSTLHFASLTLIVKDTGRAKEFYSRKLGFKVLGDFGDYVSVEVERGVTIGLHSLHEGHSHRLETKGFELSFRVDDVDEWYRRLYKIGVGFTRKPENMPCGTREAYFTDPDGHILTLSGLVKKREQPRTPV